MTPFLQIIKKNKLENYFRKFILYNNSNDLPYHNFFHTMCVMQNCFLIAYDLEMAELEIRALLIAAMFHDFNHSGGKLKDTENVKIAINGFLTASEEDDDVNNLVVDIIRATEFPYVIPEDELTIYQKIIRDADLMQTFEKNYLQQNWIGLASEMNSNLILALENSEKFWSNVKFHTDFAKKQSEKYMPSRFEDVKFLLNILKK
jgi:predicted metal-dependent HD superfamily phosphohydrolase